MIKFYMVLFFLTVLISRQMLWKNKLTDIYVVFDCSEKKNYFIAC